MPYILSSIFSRLWFFLLLVPIFPASASDNNYTKELVISSYSLNGIDDSYGGEKAVYEIKEEYQGSEKEILNSLLLFNNYSSFDPWFGSSGDKPWSWQYSGCWFVHNYVVSNSTKKRSFDGNPPTLLFIGTKNLSKLYMRLQSFNVGLCKLSKIPSDPYGSKTSRMLKFVPQICRVNYQKRYNNLKDYYSWIKSDSKAKRQPSNIEDTTIERWKYLLDCYSNEQYPPNTLLEQAMVDYENLFKSLTIYKDHSVELIPKACKFNLEMLKNFGGTPILHMNSQCKTVSEP